MSFNRLRMSTRSQHYYGHLKYKTGLTTNIIARFGICLSLKDPSIPNPEAYDERGMEMLPGVLFGDHEKIFKALLLKRLEKDGLDPKLYLQKMLVAHLNRGAAAMFPRIHDLSDFYEMIKTERK